MTRLLPVLLLLMRPKRFCQMSQVVGLKDTSGCDLSTCWPWSSLGLMLTGNTKFPIHDEHK